MAPPRTSFAQGVVKGGFVIFSVLLGVAVWNVDGPIHVSGWRTRDAVAVFALIAIIPAGSLLHLLDTRGKRLGFVDAKRREDAARGLKKAETNLEDSAVSGLLTVMSIRSALGAGILGGLWSKYSDIIGPFRAPLNWNGLSQSPVLEPRTMVFYAVSFALAASAATTLVALLCYDYSIRFAWKAANKERVKLQLRGKAQDLGVFGFYCLMWSLPAIAFLLDPILSILATAAAFFLIWLYYYFPTDALDPLEATAPAAPATTTTITSSVTNVTSDVVNVTPPAPAAPAAPAVPKANNP